MDVFHTLFHPLNGVITSVTLGQGEGGGYQQHRSCSLTRCPNSIAKLRSITSQSQSKEHASKLYRERNEKEKEDFSCPLKFLLLSEHIGVTNICDLRLQYQAAKYGFNLGV